MLLCGRPEASPARRARFLALIAVALTLLLAACTSGSDRDPSPSPSPGSARPSSSSAAPVTLRFAVYGGPARLRAYQRLARVFTTKHPDVRVEVESTPGEPAARARLGRQFVTDRAPDLFVTSDEALPALVGEGRVQPVDGLLEQRGIQFGDTFQRLGLEAMAANSALQCMPTDVSPYVVFYNKRLLDLSLLPRQGVRDPTPQLNGWSWNQFGVAAAQMSRGSVKGLYLPPRLSTLTPLMRSAGSDIVDDPKEPTTLTLADGPHRRALERVLDVARNPTVTLTKRELARKGALARFEDGKLGMMIGTRALVPRLRKLPQLRFDVFPLPSLGRSQTIADVSGVCINRVTEHTSAAADFLAFVSGDEGAEILAGSGAVVPANLTALRSAAFRDTSQFPLNVNVFAQSIRRASTMPNPPAWAEVVRQTKPLVNRLFYAPRLDLDTVLPELEQISVPLLAQPTPSASPSASTSASTSPSPSASPSRSAPAASATGSPVR